MIEKINPSVIRSKQFITEALLELMTEEDFNSIKITEITRRAQVDRKTFYRNFESKEDILIQYGDLLAQEFIKKIKATSELNCYKVGLIYFEFWLQHLEFLKLLLRQNLLVFFTCKFNKRVPDIFKEITSITNYQEIDEEFYQYQMHYIAGGIWNLLLKWIEDGAIKHLMRWLLFLKVYSILKYAVKDDSINESSFYKAIH